MNCLIEWRRWIRPLVMVLYFIILVIALPLIIVDFQVNKTGIHLQAWFISGVFVFLTIPISVWGITQHLVHYTRPDLQRCIIRILWMVPIYSVNAWFALRFKGTAIYLDTLRECYEAFVIYNFMSFLLKYLRSEYPDLEYTMERKAQVKHLFPFCVLPSWPMGKYFILHAKHGVLQYTVVRPIMTVIALICELTGHYGEGDFDFTKAWAYLVIINNISQVWALYCLVLFYKALKEELAPIRPVGKFFCVKTVVFMSFWQAVLIAILVKVGVIKESNTWGDLYDVQDIANGLQDFCICIEMFLAAVGHYFSFSHKPYVDYAAGYSSWTESFRSMWDVSDVRQDMVDHVRHVGKTVTRPLRGDTGSVSDEPRPPPNSEHTPLLGDNSLSGDESISQTPPIHITPQELHTAINHDAQQLPTSSVEDLTSIMTNESDTENFQRKSLTASMNNYAHFSESYNDAFEDDDFVNRQTVFRSDGYVSSELQAVSDSSSQSNQSIQQSPQKLVNFHANDSTEEQWQSSQNSLKSNSPSHSAENFLNC